MLAPKRFGSKKGYLEKRFGKHRDCCYELILRYAIYRHAHQSSTARVVTTPAARADSRKSIPPTFEKARSRAHLPNIPEAEKVSGYCIAG